MRRSDNGRAGVAEQLLPDDVHDVLMAIYGAFAKDLSPNFSVGLGADVVVTVAASLEIQFGAAMADVTNPGCLAVLPIYPEGTLLLEVDNSFALAMVELFLGGSSSAAPMHRELTEIETHLLIDGLDPVVSTLHSVFRRVGDYGLKIERIETNPKTIRAWTASEVVSRVDFDIQIGERQGRMSLYQSLDMARVVAGRAPEKHREDPVETFSLQLLLDCEMDLEVRLSAPDIAVRDLLGLKPGDVVHFERRLNDAVEGQLNGLRRLRGRVARNGNRRAFVVDSLVD